jgi:hypothetical protein
MKPLFQTAGKLGDVYWQLIARPPGEEFKSLFDLGGDKLPTENFFHSVFTDIKPEHVLETWREKDHPASIVIILNTEELEEGQIICGSNGRHGPQQIAYRKGFVALVVRMDRRAIEYLERQKYLLDNPGARYASYREPNQERVID